MNDAKLDGDDLCDLLRKTLRDVGLDDAEVKEYMKCYLYDERLPEPLQKKTDRLRVDQLFESAADKEIASRSAVLLAEQKEQRREMEMAVEGAVDLAIQRTLVENPWVEHSRLYAVFRDKASALYAESRSRRKTSQD